jgi:hypothetical protein
MIISPPPTLYLNAVSRICKKLKNKNYEHEPK